MPPKREPALWVSWVVFDALLRLYHFLHERFRCHTIINRACRCCHATAFSAVFCWVSVLQSRCAWLDSSDSKVPANLVISSLATHSYQQAVHNRWQQMPLNASTSGCRIFLFTFYISRFDSWQNWVTLPTRSNWNALEIQADFKSTRHLCECFGHDICKIWLLLRVICRSLMGCVLD